MSRRMETRKRKRQREVIESIDPSEIADITDYEDELTTKTAEEFDYIIETIKDTRGMNYDELELVNKIRKKIKHRDDSRMRRKYKKEYVDGLKERVKELEEENKELREQLMIINRFTQPIQDDPEAYADFIDVETPSSSATSSDVEYKLLDPIQLLEPFDPLKFTASCDAGDLPLCFEYEYFGHTMYVFDPDTYI